MRSLAADLGSAISARIRAAISSIQPPYFAAGRVLEHAGSTSSPMIS